MTIAHLRIALPAAILVAVAAAPSLAQRPLSPEQRVMMLEQQLAASQAAALRLEQRLDSIERQLQQLINQGEVGGHRVSQLEAELARLRADLDARITAVENRPVAQPPAAAENLVPLNPPVRVADSPPPKQPPAKPAPTGAGATAATAETDPGEEAYSEGFRLWRDGKHSQAITALRAFTSAFPRHKRVSYANNLIGRALLDSGNARPAADALLANYRSNPKGERAADSLYYLGQALTRLGQPGQACKAYEELEEVYGSSIRSELRSLVDKGKAQANCG